MKRSSRRSGRRGGGQRGSTLLVLVHEAAQCGRSDAEVIRVVRRQVNSGEVVLTGTFAGRRF